LVAFRDEQTVAVFFLKADDVSLERSAVSGQSAGPVTFFAWPAAMRR